MNQSMPTTAVPDVLDDLGGGVSLGGADLFERIWHFFISMRTGLVLILALAVLNLVGTLLAQAPAGMTADRAAYAAWLDSVRPKYGGWTTVFDTLGFFSIFSSIWFKGLSVLLCTSILACSVNRAPRLWRQAVHPRTAMSGSFFRHAAMRSELTSGAELPAAGAALDDALARRGFRRIASESEGALDLYADRFRWGPFGTVIAHLSIILVVGGAVLGAGGFHDASFAATIGSTVDVGHGTGLSVLATSFSDSYYENGSPSDYASHLIVYDGGRQVADATIRVNQPLQVGDVTFYQSFYGPAADLSVSDVTGATVFEGGVPLQWTSTDGTKAIGQFDLSSKGYSVYVVGVASGQVDSTIAAGQLQLEVYDASTANADTSTPIAVQVVDQGVPATIGGLEFTFNRERQFTGLIVARDPGAPLVWTGSIFLVLGVALVFYFPYRRIWARVARSADGTRIEFAAITRHDGGFESSFNSLVNDVRSALSGAADD
jgi:cytochrome c biogenesis protein